ncbi:hypothetical protein [Alkalihalobacillus sp. 1P02AB]|uniref:hypothetical protein n=1 Tax=Alkalihalobacillus sp. 1P02AB TaxID=3132260 RepID=UPI0039A5CE9D
MNIDCFCGLNQLEEIKIEADIGAEPIWCQKCGANLELAGVPLSPSLKNKLNEWVLSYGKWIDWEQDKLKPNGMKMEDEHNKIGESLTVKVKEELQDVLNVSFSPTKIADIYIKKAEGAN